MILKLSDYESLTIEMDGIPYFLHKNRIGFTLKRLDGERIYCDASLNNRLFIDGNYNE